MEFFSKTAIIMRRELRSYFESPVAYVFIVVFLLICGIFTFILEHFYEVQQADLSRPFFRWHPWFYMVLVPAAAMRLWAEERRSGTIELLLTMPITMSQAILAKFLSAWIFLAVALLLTFPVVLTTYYLGSPDAGVIVGGYVGSVLIAGAYVAVGLLTSAMTRNQVISFILSVVFCFFGLLVPGLLSSMLAGKCPTWMVDAIASISVLSHYDAMQQGVLDLRDVLYFFSIMAFMLFATQLVLENRKSA